MKRISRLARRWPAEMMILFRRDEAMMARLSISMNEVCRHITHFTSETDKAQT